jgi:O-methyltransferase domain
VRTGENAFKHVFGMGSFQHLAQEPERAALFNAYMPDLTRPFVAAILAAHDFSRYRRIVDVGGGNGALLSSILAIAPAAEGLIFDTQTGIEGAGQRLEEAGVADRCRSLAGDFFEAVPEAAAKSALPYSDQVRAAAQYVAKGQFRTQEGQPPSSSNNGRILSQAWMTEHQGAAFDHARCVLAWMQTNKHA